MELNLVNICQFGKNINLICLSIIKEVENMENMRKCVCWNAKWIYRFGKLYIEY